VTQHDILYVLMMPNYCQDNPYQSLLAEATAAFQVKIGFTNGYRRGLPIFRAVLDQPQAVDVLHLHWLETYFKGTHPIVRYFYTLKFLLDVFLVRSSGVKLVWTVHNVVEHDTPFPRLELWAQRILVKLAHRVVLLNRSTMEQITKNYQCDRAKVSIIPHGHYRAVYGEAIDPKTAREKLNLPLEGKIYLHLGILRPYKGLEALLQAWQANPNLADCTLVIAGQPHDAAYEQHLAKLIAPSQNIRFYPQFVADEVISRFFSAADVAVLPYRKILNSGSAILAMSFGKPVIAPRLGSLPEILGNAGTLLYDAADQSGISQALQKSLECDLNGLSQQTIEACDRLGWQDIGQQTAAAYRRCFSRSTDQAPSLLKDN
jgi:beta-1,4-mannosyltransferase